MNPVSILQQYYFPGAEFVIKPLGSGLINHTYLANIGEEQFVLQQINTSVFKNPGAIAQNIFVVGNFLRQNHPDYIFIVPITAKNGEQMIQANDHSMWRLFPFVKNSHTIDIVQTEGQAYEAAKAFGLFAKNLSNFSLTHLQITIPDFHNLSLRMQQFESALKNGNKERIQLSRDTIDLLLKRKNLVEQFNDRIVKGLWKQRVMHHDTKISNVLFGKDDKAICVIDLDTIMPGYFFSDVGDMLRTYLCPLSEEETNFSEITVRDSFFQAIVKGYVSDLNNELSVQEKKDFVLAGKLMIYMQALRFLTDFLNNDVYYGAKYELHNYNRALNQIELLKRIEEKGAAWNSWLKKYFNF